MKPGKKPKPKPKKCPNCLEPLSDGKLYKRDGEKMCLECAEYQDFEDAMTEDHLRHAEAAEEEPND